MHCSYTLTMMLIITTLTLTTKSAIKHNPVSSTAFNYRFLQLLPYVIVSIFHSKFCFIFTGLKLTLTNSKHFTANLSEKNSGDRVVKSTISYQYLTNRLPILLILLTD